MDAKAIKCIFIGYCSQFKAYKLFDPSTHKVFASRDVLFHEQETEISENSNQSHEEWHRVLDEQVLDEGVTQE